MEINHNTFVLWWGKKGKGNVWRISITGRKNPIEFVWNTGGKIICCSTFFHSPKYPDLKKALSFYSTFGLKGKHVFSLAGEHTGEYINPKKEMDKIFKEICIYKLAFL